MVHKKRRIVHEKVMTKKEMVKRLGELERAGVPYVKITFLKNR
jgi:hypothetical protein